MFWPVAGMNFIKLIKFWLNFRIVCTEIEYMYNFSNPHKSVFIWLTMIVIGCNKSIQLFGARQIEIINLIRRWLKKSMHVLHFEHKEECLLIKWNLCCTFSIRIKTFPAIYTGVGSFKKSKNLRWYENLTQPSHPELK